MDKGVGGNTGFKIDREKTSEKRWTGREREVDKQRDRALSGLRSKRTASLVLF